MLAEDRTPASVVDSVESSPCQRVPSCNFDEISDRLDQIIATVRSKDTSLERSLDLFDEAIELGSRAVDMVDKFELTPREADKLEQEYDEDAANESQDS